MVRGCGLPLLPTVCMFLRAYVDTRTHTHKHTHINTHINTHTCVSLHRMLRRTLRGEAVLDPKTNTTRALQAELRVAAESLCTTSKGVCIHV
jgi:hypothetical protein